MQAAEAARGGEREARHFGKAIEQRFQQPVIGAEIMPPFGDTMGLINGKKRDIY